MWLYTTITNQVGYTIYSTGGQGFMAVSKQTKSSAYTFVLSLFTAITLWHCNINLLWNISLVCPIVRITMVAKLKLIEMLITTTRFHYYHIRQLWNLLPVCGHISIGTQFEPYESLLSMFELAQSQDCRSNQYQRTHMKLVTEK